MQLAYSVYLSAIAMRDYAFKFLVLEYLQTTLRMLVDHSWLMMKSFTNEKHFFLDSQLVTVFTRENCKRQVIFNKEFHRKCIISIVEFLAMQIGALCL